MKSPNVVSFSDSPAFFNAMTPNAVLFDGARYHVAVNVHWCVMERAQALTDIERHIDLQLDDYGLWPGTDDDGEVFESVKAALLTTVDESFLPAEVQALREYLDWPVYTEPLETPVRLHDDGDAPSTLREMIRDRDRPGGHFSGETGFLNLSDLPGYPLPFKVSGYFQLPEAYRRHHLDDETRLRALRVALC